MEGRIATEELHKEIDLIQGCITRMADNSFRLKEWYITLIATASAILISQDKGELYIIGLFLLGVTVVFWGLDAFFLKMETLYRWKYEWVIEKRRQGEDAYLYDLSPNNRNMWLNINQKNDCYMKFIFTKTLVPLYGVVMVIGGLLFVITIVP